jgi:hypothetical protein
MEDLGNIVYVVAALAWFAWNAYRKMQGKEEATPKPGTPERHETGQPEKPWESARSLEDLIMEQLGQKPAPAPKPAVQPIKTDNSSKFLSSDLTHSHLKADYVMSSSETRSPRVERLVKKGKGAVLEEEVDLIEELFPAGLDMKQAFVLNSILDRPYK